MRVPFDELHDTLPAHLLTTGMAAERADLCARLFAEASRDGVASHGLNRFPRFLRMIATRHRRRPRRPGVRPAAGALERWDGRRGPGNLNARESMARAIALARGTASAASRSRTPTTGCAAAATAGRRPRPA